MVNQPRVLFYFLHLLGVGHIHRAKRLIEGFSKQGIAVDIIYGGERLPNVTFAADSIHYLSPIRSADNAYSHYLDSHGNPLGREFQDQRCREIINIFEGLDPDAILIEAFPFGRRMVRYEMQALLDAAAERKKPPIIISSVRDILQERKKAGRVEETVEWINTYFDHIMVHSDPNIIELDATFPLVGKIRNKLAYTGFVVPEKGDDALTQTLDILVSAGGGAFGGSLMKTALEAAVRTPGRQWCLTTGPNLSSKESDQLEKNKPGNLTLKTHLDNLSIHMKQANISISQCGYNTAMDVLAAHHSSPCRAVFVPYDTEGQSEQLRRSQLLEKAGYAINLPQSNLSVEKLLVATERAGMLQQVQQPVDFDGVTKSARFLKKWLESR